ncbi:MAG: DUF721 domain-containing protein [Bacteroidales bacterium]|nr:DUF721 domain-containing protein [Bacteroidales bacterium]
MKNSNEQKLNDVIRDLLETYKLQDKITETKLIRSWESVAGSYISKSTDKIYISRRKLYVRLNSPALKHELMFAREKLIKALNDSVQNEVIDEIVFL